MSEERLLKSLSECTRNELEVWLASRQQAKFRAAQLENWVFGQFAMSFDEMQNLPKDLRVLLAEEYVCSALEVIDCQRATEDDTIKWLSRLQDGNTIETVLIPAGERRTVCISTQVGCAVQCAFCASGRHGLVRNLTVGEIVDQVRLAARNSGSGGLDNIVVMGIGEPMHNRENLVQALNIICSTGGLGLGARHVTISTSGIVPEMLELAKQAKPWNLAISLHAVNDAQRARIIPPKNRYPIADILAAARVYRASTNRMVTIEYALVKNLNDSLEDAKALAEIARSIRAKVNLIPCNNQTGTFLPPPTVTCREFLNVLLGKNIQASLRLKKGGDIQAACGQLRAKNCGVDETSPEKEEEKLDK